MTPGIQLGSYEILSPLGKGGMGEVWRAKDSKLGREVAIKTLPEEFAQDEERLARFEREAKLLASLNHPNIAAIYGLEEDNGTRFLVLELVEGDTLADRLKRGAIPVEESLTLALQIAEALEAAHEKGVIHRDLKPLNIKITPAGKIKVLDFGLAKAFAGDGSDVNLSQSPTLSMAATEQGVILGTAAYMSPEQARGVTVDKRADIWAFGCVLYEMLTGRQVFKGELMSDVMASVLKSDPDYKGLPPAIHPQLRAVLRRCLEKEPKQRWHDIGDVRIELEQVSEDPSGTLVLPVAGVAQAAPQSKLPWVATFVLGLFIASVAVWTLKPVPPPGPRPVSRHRHDIPEGINTWVNTIAVSKDGQYYVYKGTDALYLRSRNELEALVIAGTEGNVYNPFFSPDSAWVGFWTGEGRIEKIAISGGTPIPIGPAPRNPQGISWGADDIVLFSQRDGIYSVSANGGTPDRIIEALDDELLSSPTVLPSGRGILFTSRLPGGRWDNAEIVVASLDAPEDRTVVWNGSAASYAPTGHLIYALGNDLFAIAFDPDTLETSGTAVSLEQGLARATFGGDSANYGMSEDGSLVYRADPGIQQRVLVWVDSEGNETPVGAPIDDYRDTSVSPDGSSVALTINDGTQSDIYVWNFARQTTTRLTFDEAGDGRPVWTPDSQQIIFRSLRDGSGNIYRRSADGTGTVEQLTEGTLNEVPGSLSSDGATLAFHQTGGPAANDILMLDLASGTSGEANREPVMWLQTEFGEARPMISPDGRWVAYNSIESGRNEIHVRPFADAGQWQVSRAGGGAPLWSPDGQWLYYRSFRRGGQMMRVAIDADTAFRFGNPEPLFDYPIGGAGISPDGRFLLMRDVEVETEPFRPHIITVLNWFEELKERVPVP